MVESQSFCLLSADWSCPQTGAMTLYYFHMQIWYYHSGGGRNGGGRTMAKTMKNVDVLCSGIVLTTITIAIAIVSRPEFL